MTFPKTPPPGAFKRIDVPAKERFFDRVEGLLPMKGNRPAWVEMLKLIKYPTTVVTLDFETHFSSDYHMGKGGDSLSTIEYVTSPKFEAIGLANLTMTAEYPYADYQANAQCEIGEERIKAHIEYLKGLYGPRLEGCTVSFHNAKFDATVLRVKYNLIPKYIIDTLDLARAWNSRQVHGLDALAEQWGLPAKGDTSEFKNLTLKVRYEKPKGKKAPKMPVRVPTADAEQLGRLAGYATNDAARQWEVFTILFPRLSNPCVEVRVMRHTLDLFLHPKLGVDFDHGKKLVQVFREQLDSAVHATAQTSEEISGDKSFQALLCEAVRQAGDDPQQYMKQMKRGSALATSKTDDQRELLVNHADERVRLLMAARIAQDSWPLHIGRANKIMRQALAAGGLLLVPLHYYGAATGRFSGGESLNLQNLPKEGILALIRQLLIAPPGYKLIVVDAAAIEARVLAWLAGQWDLVDKFARNEEIYCGFASKVLGYKVRKPRKDGPIKAIEDRMTWARNKIGKIGILGGGYGMGQDKFFALGAGAFDLDTAGKIKDTYRAENAEIVKLWGTMEQAFIHTAKYHKPSVLERGVRFDSYNDCDVVMTLPNGRELHYLKVKLGRGNFNKESARVFNAREMSWEHIWGGTLVENAVQAISRDVLTEATLRLEDQGVGVVLTVHDEVVCVVEGTKADAALKLAVKEMSATPTWGDRMPLGAEGGIYDRYQK